MPVGFNCPTVDLKPFKLTVTCIIPADLNLVVTGFDLSPMLTFILGAANNSDNTVRSVRSVQKTEPGYSGDNAHFYL